MTKGLVYYSDCRADPEILSAVRRLILRSCNGHQVVSVTLQPVDLGTNLVLPLQRSRLSMFKQILAGLTMLDTDIAFLVEHDVLYNPTHFAFDPPRRDVYYYNRHTWRVDAKTGQALFYLCDNTSGLCADRGLLLEHYRRRVDRTEREGYDHQTGYEPGKHHPPHGIDRVPVATWMSERPLVDIRHRHNLTASRWDPSQFRNKNSCLGWQMADEIPGWGVTKGRFREWLREVTT